MLNDKKNLRFKSLDGWRGISILLVMAGHLLPLGFKSWQLNFAVPSSGMAIFFILSGFLITNLLLKEHNLKHFLVRRLARILPLAWLVLVLMLTFNEANLFQWLGNLFFYANWPPIQLLKSNGHFWSLCAEVQFYLFIALLIAVLKNKAFITIPFLCIAVTVLRMSQGVEMSINTLYRGDEILAGCCLALLFNTNIQTPKDWLGQLNTPLLFMLLIASAHPLGGFMNYLRPYIAMLLVGSTLFSHKSNQTNSLFNNQYLIYIASISYALYVIHGALDSSWLGSGDTFEKYAKRPLLLALTWLLAHLSTFYYEKYWIVLSKKLTSEKPPEVTRAQLLKHYISRLFLVRKV